MSRLILKYWSCGPLVIATASLSFSLTALCVKWIGSDLPPFETVSSSAVMCFLALSAILCQQRLPLVRLPPPAPADGPREPLLLPTTCGDVEAAGKGLGSACVVAAGRQPSTQQRYPSTARVMALTLTRAVCGSVATTCFYLALEMLSLKDAVTLFFTSPVVALLLDWVLLGHAPGCRGAAATLLTLLGATCVTQPPFIFKRLPFLPRGGGSGTHSGGAAGTLAAGAAADVPFFVALRQSTRSSAQPPQLLAQAGAAAAGAMGGPALGAMLALAAAVANASGFVAAGLLRGHQHPAVLTWWYNGVLAVVTGVPLAAAVPLPAVLPTPRAAALLCGVGATQLVAQLCLNRGFQLESAGRGAAINVLQVLFSFILDVAVLHTRPSLLSVLGSALVAAGVLSVALGGGSGTATATTKRTRGDGCSCLPGDGRGPPSGTRDGSHPADEGSDGDCCTEADAALAPGVGLSWMSASASASSDGGLHTRAGEALLVKPLSLGAPARDHEAVVRDAVFVETELAEAREVQERRVPSPRPQ